ncbi:MAG: toxin-antitoxin system HicB family antitoxin [Janthinobacterium lividum]
MNSGNSASSMIERFTADMYSITIRREQVEGEMFFVGRVREFPDVEVFEESHDMAYSETVSTLTDLIAQLQDEGMQVPQPLVINDVYSGRVTLRMSKSMHRRVDRCAEDEGVSINTFVTSAIENYLAHTSNRVMQVPMILDGAELHSNMVRTEHVIANTSRSTAGVRPQAGGYAILKTPSSTKPALFFGADWGGERLASLNGTGVLHEDTLTLTRDEDDPMHRHFYSDRTR